MSLLVKFENDMGSVGVHTTQSGFGITTYEATRQENQYGSEAFGFGASFEVIKRFFTIRENLKQVQLDYNSECEIIKVALALTDSEIRDGFEKFSDESENDSLVNETLVAYEIAIKKTEA